MKPISKSVKDYLVEQLSEQMELPESVVNQVIRFQGMDALAHIDEVTSLEFSGFGKISVSPNKTVKKIKKKYRSLEIKREGIENPNVPQETKDKYTELIPILEEDINYLKMKYEQVTGTTPALT